MVKCGCGRNKSIFETEPCADCEQPVCPECVKTSVFDRRLLCDNCNHSEQEKL